MVEILTVLYFHTMRIRPEEPGWRDRDRLILSKGHAAPALYAILAETGYFPLQTLHTFRRMGSILQGHPDLRVPGVDVVSGSLGQGLSVANGIAIAAKLDGRGSRTYALLGDGECDEGQIWEAAMTAAHYRLDNLTAIIDRNRMQSDGPTELVKMKEPLGEKWRAFGWKALETDGHCLKALVEVFEATRRCEGAPTVVIANTVKGKGISFTEGDNDFHNGSLTPEQFRHAMRELD